MGQFGVGQGLRRVEDLRLLTGQGRYSGDIDLPEAAQSVLVRSPYAHADITAMDLSAARAAPGVLGVYSIEDLDADGIPDNPCLVPLPGKGGSATIIPARPFLARQRVRHVGEPVVFIVAETLAAAQDAAELVEIDYDDLPVVTGTDAARAADAPQLWPEAPGNLSLDWEQGDKAATDAAFAQAVHVTRLEMVNNRVVINSLEPRGAVGIYDAADDSYTLYTGTQGSHRLRTWLAEQIFKIPADKMRVVTPDVGGGFGMKIFIYPDQILVLWAARRLGRPIRWMSDRSEAFLSDSQGRDHVTQAELALDKEGKFLGLRCSTTAAMGAYLSTFAPFIPTACYAKMLSGLYAIPAIYSEVACVFTNTVPVDAYRGAGRPEAAYVVERLVDQAAHDLGLAPDEIRRRNFIPPSALPYKTAIGEIYDSGDFQGIMEKAMAGIDWAGLPARRAASAAAGKARGIGMACYVEACGGVGSESSRISLNPDGSVVVTVGTMTNGQGHATAYCQILADKLGLAPEQIEIRQGDSNDGLPVAGGTGGSRSLLMGGTAIGNTADLVVERARTQAAEILEAAEADIEFAEGTFTIVGTDRQVSLREVAEASYAQGQGIEETWQLDAASMTYPNGCHICELEVDPDSGIVEIQRYVVFDDFGRLVNPLLVAGQVHGGVAQGLGQALLEETVYEDGSGQLLSGSWMDYCMPRADDMPEIELTLVEDTPCTTNALGVKGAGEAGAIGACPAAMNALLDALRPYGVTHLDMPATPEKIWRALRSVKAA